MTGLRLVELHSIPGPLELLLRCFDIEHIDL